MALKKGRIIVILIAVAILCQVIQIKHSNPPITSKLQASQELSGILNKSCFDCHSNETVWPWYSHIAPMSWLVAFDVYEGRQHLNFSTWGEYTEEKQAKLREKIWKVIDEGEMPPIQYLPAHLNARLSDQDKAIFRSWASTQAGTN